MNRKLNEIVYGGGMKKLLSIIFCLSPLLCFVIAVLLYHCIQLKRSLSNETLIRQHAEWTTFYGIGNVGQSVSLDSITQNHHFILRYDQTTCLPCIAKAEELLDEVFGKEFLTKELCCIGDKGQIKPSKGIFYIQSNEKITPMDDVYTPYFCIINDKGDILFTLSLIPDMYNYNREILIRLKRALTES